MTPRRRVIAGEYAWECEVIWGLFVREEKTRTPFPELYRRYRGECVVNSVRPVVAHIFASILRREAVKMEGVKPEGTVPIWVGIR